MNAANSMPWSFYGHESADRRVIAQSTPAIIKAFSHTIIRLVCCLALMACFVPVCGQAQPLDIHEAPASPLGGMNDDEEHMPPDLRQSFELMASQQGLLEDLSDAEGAPMISDWSALGEGMNGWVRALTHDGTYLYAGGEFTNAGGMEANRIARWDGTTRRRVA